jgi:hypothetical protein
LEKIKNNTLYCDINYNAPTPNYSCDVPGPLFYLVNDPNVPLYNYTNNVYSYSNLPPSTPPWVVYNNYNVALYSNIYSTISTVYFKKIAPDNNDTVNMNININVPIGLQFSLYTNPSILSNGLTITVNIIDVKLSFFYNETNKLTTTPENDFNKEFTFHLNNMTNSPKITATFFLGHLSVDNATLRVVNGNVFDLKCLIRCSIRGTVNNTGRSVSFHETYVICNLTNQQIYLINDGIIDYTPPPSPPNKPYSPFSISISESV